MAAAPVGTGWGPHSGAWKINEGENALKRVTRFITATSANSDTLRQSFPGCGLSSQLLNREGGLYRRLQPRQCKMKGPMPGPEGPEGPDPPGPRRVQNPAAGVPGAGLHYLRAG